MTRSADAEIPTSEELYRSISRDDLAGDDVLPSAVDLPRCSFNRSKYSVPESVIVEARPNDTGIVSVTPERLPEPVPRASAPERPYEFFAQDDPNPPEDPANDAHCEVRIRPRGQAFSKNHKVNKEILAKAKDALARKLHLVRHPNG